MITNAFEKGSWWVKYVSINNLSVLVIHLTVSDTSFKWNIISSDIISICTDNLIWSPNGEKKSNGVEWREVCTNWSYNQSLKI